MDKGPDYTFIQRRHINDYQVCEKLLHITNYQRNENQNHSVYHLTPVRMAIIKSTKDNKGWRGCGEIGAIVHYWWECKKQQPLKKTVWRFLNKLKIELPCDPAILLLGIYSKELKSGYQRDICTPMFIATLFTIAKI